MKSKSGLKSASLQGQDVSVVSQDDALHRQIESRLTDQSRKTSENLRWLHNNMHPYFFITMKEEVEAIIHLAERLPDVASEKEVVLVNQEKKQMIARLDVPGSIYDTLKTLHQREISYAEMSHSYTPIPEVGKYLEIQRYEFDRKSHEEIAGAGLVKIPGWIKGNVQSAMKRLYPEYDFTEFDASLKLLWSNNHSYVRISPPERVARVLRLYQQGKQHDGLFFDVEIKEDERHHEESRVLFSVGNPPQKDFLTQVSEIFQRLGIGVRRSYCLIISTGVHPYFLGNFYVLTYDGKLVEKGSELFRKLQNELYNTQILSSSSVSYTDFVTNHILTGEEASLTNAFAAFCHTFLAHKEPDRFDESMVTTAFHSNPDITLRLIRLFKTRFDPDTRERETLYEKERKEALEMIEGYNTGHRYLDEIRRTIFKTCLFFIQRTLKTNFFVPEKHALAFRLDPGILSDLEQTFTSDLPQGKPFRITFFFSRHAVGYHIGFSDIARGGWRTIICKTPDECTTNTNSLFKEVYVLAHTQHLKNKDIYEGGSKLTVVVDAVGLDSPTLVTQRLYKVQYGILNAFLDLFVTEKGRAKHPNVVDYYGEDEPIELGPDENMSDSMIEFIARQSVKRGYILGIGIMSSKEIGINHKEYGVTSRGVMKFAEVAMKEIGIDIGRDSFTVRFTGGPNGDVAGNSMRLLLERCSKARLLSIVDGTAGLYDPEGAERAELRRIVLKHDLDHFRPEALHPGGFILFRGDRRQDGPRELYRKVVRIEEGAEETWITVDEFYKEMDDLVFTVCTDLFLPCGGRPETIDRSNWQKLLDSSGKPSLRVMTEGANSFITPVARSEIQKKGVIVLRDASANKCGVISSSYEIIANLLMTAKEFLAHKEAYVQDVLAILERRAEEEAKLIFQRHREGNGKLFYTDISNAISEEINDHYAKLFSYFQGHPELCGQPLFRKVLLNHLPALIRENPKFRSRVEKMPAKIKHAILSSEIASRIVYHGGWELDFEGRLKEFVKEKFE
ncbi:MAG: glutamate dehydrogenase [Deltaproteobacteria bacterium]|nr:glutamate dehydrogenase [Deltaproteobacteria bacterium]